MRETLLATMWSTDGDADEAAEQVIRKLESGELELTGNFRNAPADGWRKDEEK
jgi:hypothetical protein